jgi:hypothetical protein
MNTDKVERLTCDKENTARRSRETLGVFVIAAHMLEKGRADLLGINGA